MWAQFIRKAKAVFACEPVSRRDSAGNSLPSTTSKSISPPFKCQLFRRRPRAAQPAKFRNARAATVRAEGEVEVGDVRHQIGFPGVEVPGEKLAVLGVVGQAVTAREAKAAGL